MPPLPVVLLALSLPIGVAVLFALWISILIPLLGG